MLVDDLPHDAFDLIHFRLLLAWLGDAEAALSRLVPALVPGGWLLAEEMDFVSVAPDPRLGEEAASTFVRVAEAHASALAAQHRFDPSYGRKLATDLERAGLVELGSEGRAAIWRGGETGGTAWRLTFEQLREPMLATGLVTGADIDRAIALCGDPEFRLLSQITVAAWGRRPSTG